MCAAEWFAAIIFWALAAVVVGQMIIGLLRRFRGHRKRENE
jgi:hypothetical protein